MKIEIITEQKPIMTTHTCPAQYELTFYAAGGYEEIEALKKVLNEALRVVT